MAKRNNFKILEIFNPSDSVFILGFILGLIVAIFFNVIEIRIIGGSVAILAALRIVMIVKERSSYIPDTKRIPVEKKNFAVTQITDKKATRVVIEDFGKQFEEESDEKEKKIPFDEKFIDKFSIFTKKVEAPKAPPKEEPTEIEFSDPEGGVNIKIRKIKKEVVNPPVEEVVEKTEIPVIQEKPIESIETPSPAIEPDLDEIFVQDEIFEDALISNQIEDPIQEIETPINETIAPSPFKPKQLDFDMSLLIEDEQLSSGEPKKEFEFFIQRILKIIRSVTSTRTASFLLVNQEKAEMVLIACVTDQPDAITKQKKLPISNDIASQIITNQKPEILSDINPSAELDLIPYYTRNVGTNSFIGVPVFFGNTVTALICADTNTNDAYDVITVGFLGHFTKLVSSLMQSYTEKFELVQAEKSLIATKEFRNAVSGTDMDAAEIFKIAISNISKIVDYTTIGIVAYDENQQKWMIKALMSKKPNETYDNFEVDLNNSLIKNTITLCKQESSVIEDNNIIRINHTEPFIEKGYFISVPIKSFKNNFGALYLENRNTTSYSNNDLLLLGDIADTAGIAIEQLVYNTLVNNQPMMETNTGILNSVAFNGRLDEELSKSNDFNTPLSLLMFKVDNYSAINNQLFQANYDPINQHVINIIERFVKKYDIIGHIDESTFAIALLGMTLQNANNWARRLRSEIASSSIVLNNRRFNVTISGGLAEYKKSLSTETLVHNTKMVLEIAAQKGNNIKTFN